MKTNESKYFNFGFSFADYKQFILKSIYMRAERILIERTLE